MLVLYPLSLWKFYFRGQYNLHAAEEHICVHYLDLFAGLVNCAGLKVGRDDIIDNTVATSLRSEAEGDRSLDRLLAVEGKGVGWRLLEVV